MLYVMWMIMVLTWTRFYVLALVLIQCEMVVQLWSRLAAWVDVLIPSFSNVQSLPLDMSH